ncbi:TIGR03826 family flagellar region protein [Bacillus pinisoli]|uniref:TIGR03826 family flagellar region protein n=1 Tax=Bacillus pinisoli TaxID=2901866 RepID=UPI001FF34FAC|nr:TIGR03826 family flagellar region protein [Bacillus pinisoli]
MGELANCPKCDKLFVATPAQDVCPTCYKEEQQLFETVYNYIRKKENRMATLPEVAEATDVEETLVIKWIRTGKLKLAQFPNLGYPCEKCKTLIRQGKICDQCAKGLQQDLKHLQEEEDRLKKEKTSTFLRKF